MRSVAAAAALVVALVGAGCQATPAPPGTGRPAWSTPGCGRLAASSGTVIDVTPAQAGQLPAIVAGAPAGATVRLADGTYALPGGSAGRVVLSRPGVTLRGASGDPARVVIDGRYGVGDIVTVAAADVTITDLTVTRAVDHLVHAVPPDAGPGVDRLRLHRLGLVDAGEQFVKVNPNGGRSAFADDGTLACSALTMTAAGRTHIERAFGCYTGGIDVHSARGWRVRSNTFDGIYCEDGEVAEHAIHFWVGSRDTVVENNLIKSSSRGIGFGLVESGPSRTYPDDPYPGLFVGHYGGVIRNNVILGDISQYDTGIELAQARGTRVLHNTVAESSGAARSFSSIDYRFANTFIEVRNNLTRRITVRDGALGTSSDNVIGTPSAWFVDVAAGDVHLSPAATGAIDRGLAVAGSGVDLDGTTHDAGRPDIGADERRPAS